MGRSVGDCSSGAPTAQPQATFAPWIASFPLGGGGMGAEYDSEALDKDTWHSAAYCDAAQQGKAITALEV